jgi:outer membrane protein assembly factor BamB
MVNRAAEDGSGFLKASARPSLLALLVLSFVTPVQADVTVPGETGSSLRRIQAVDKAIAGGEINEAVEELQRILDEAGDDLVPLTKRSSVRARWLCHQRLAALPPDARKGYREKIDERARKWLQEGEAKHDPALLRQVVDEAFCSKSGDRALDRLGDLAFERGDFDAAERWWRLIALPAGEEKASDSLVFPDPEVDVARVRAKQIVARIYRGDREGLSGVLKAFAAAHPKAMGDLAGRRGAYVETLQALLTAPVSEGEEWPTFAGAVSRNRILGPAPGKPNWRVPKPGPTWVRRLDGRVVPRDGEPAPVGSSATLAFHPIIVGDQVFIADARYVRAFNLLTGEAQLWFDLAADGDARNLNVSLKLPAPVGLSYTLSAEGDRLFIRMGGQRIEPPPAAAADGAARKRASLDSYLVCLDRRQPRRLLWSEKARQGEALVESFEGTPLVFDGRVFAAAVRFEGGGAITAIACHDSDTGASRWKQALDVSDVQGADEGKPRARQHLLTRAGGRIIYCSHSGVVVALEADTGRRSWAARYPTRGRLTDDARPSPRDLAPAIYAGSRLFIAPLDYDRILCLDADSGKLLWESDPLEAVHLLGVTGGKLILTTRDGIRALTIDNGKSRRDWMQPGDGSQLAPFGRGLLAGGWVYWPTTAGLRVLEQETGELVDDPAAPFNITANEIRGNLAAANGCLIIADNERLTAYLPPRQFLEKRRSESKAEPESNAARLRLAIAQADAGQHVTGLKDLSLVEKNSGDDDRLSGVSLKTLARQLRHDVLRARANAEVAAGKSREAAAALQRAAGAEFAFDDRIVALTARARLWERAEQWAEAVAAWQDVLTACIPERRANFPVGARASHRAQDAAGNIARLVAAHGKALYEPIQRQAADLLKNARDSRESLEEIAALYPNSETATAVLTRLAALERKEHPGNATTAYRLLLQRESRPALRAAILVNLAELYEREQAWHAARQTWLRLAGDHGDYLVAGRSAAREFVPEHLRSDALRQGTEPIAVTLPLIRTWEISLTKSEAMLESHGLTESAFVFFVRAGPKTGLICRDSGTGKPRWQIELPHRVTWLGIHADLAIAAGPDGVSAARLHDGSLAWQLAGEAGPMSDFQLAGERLFLMEDGRRLVALDGETGERRWDVWAPGGRLGLTAPAGRFGPHYLAGASRLLAQAPSGRGWVIDAGNGKVLHELSASDTWPRPPLALDDRRAAIVADNTHVVVVDLLEGKEWSQYGTRKPALTGEAPRVVADAKGLLVLSDGWLLDGVTLEGEAAWSRGNPDWISRQNDDPSMALDADSVYVIVRDVIHAIRRADGKERWTFSLPTARGPWELRRTRDHVVVHLANGTRPRPATLADVRPPSRSTPHVARTFPVLFLDPSDGSPLQRLNFLQDEAQASVQLLGPGVVVSISGKAHGLTPRPHRQN